MAGIHVFVSIAFIVFIILTTLIATEDTGRSYTRWAWKMAVVQLGFFITYPMQVIFGIESFSEDAMAIVRICIMHFMLTIGIYVWKPFYRGS